MTWNWCAFGGGETRDDLVDGWTDYGTGNVLTKNANGMSVISTPVQTGTGALLLTPGSTVGGNAFAYTGQLVTLVSGRLTVVMGYVNPDALPSHKFRLIACFGSLHANSYALDCNTDGTLQIALYPNSYSNFAEPTPISPKTASVLVGGSYKHVCWIIDPISYGTSHVIHHILIDGISEMVFDAGQEPTYSTLGPPALDFSDFVIVAGTTATGCVVRLDDVAAAYSTTASDAPHITALPLALVDAQHPSAAGVADGWGMYPGTGETRYQDWDDATGNDGDSTYLFASSTALVQDSDMESSATLGWGGGAGILEGGTGKGPAWVIVDRVAVGIGSKFVGWTYGALSGSALTAVSVTKPGVTYEGFGCRLTHPSGSWAAADLANLNLGAATGATDHDMKWQITLLMAQWLYYEATLPLTPTPMIAGAMII